MWPDLGRFFHFHLRGTRAPIWSQCSQHRSTQSGGTMATKAGQRCRRPSETLTQFQNPRQIVLFIVVQKLLQGQDRHANLANQRLTMVYPHSIVEQRLLHLSILPNLPSFLPSPFSLVCIRLMQIYFVSPDRSPGLAGAAPPLAAFPYREKRRKQTENPPKIRRSD